MPKFFYLVAPLLLLICCTSVDVVRVQPDLLHPPKGTEPIAGIQVSTIGFYFLTLGMPNVSLDKAINDLLIKEARKIGAHRVVDLHFDATPEHGIWWLTKLLGFRTASASGVAVLVDEQGGSSEPVMPTPTPAPASTPTPTR